MKANGAEGFLIPLKEHLQALVSNDDMAHVKLTKSQRTLRKHLHNVRGPSHA
jgi:hypothetical protein